jgi:hypothetical protein
VALPGANLTAQLQIGAASQTGVAAEVTLTPISQTGSRGLPTTITVAPGTAQTVDPASLGLDSAVAVEFDWSTATGTVALWVQAAEDPDNTGPMISVLIPVGRAAATSQVRIYPASP